MLDLYPREQEFEAQIIQRVGTKYNLGCKEEAAPCQPMTLKERAARANKKQEPDMKATYISTNVNAVDNQDANARSYLSERAYSIRITKDADLRKTFGLSDDVYPHDPKDMVKRIQDGKFVIEEGRHGNTLYWRDPTMKVDNDGYKAAYEKMDAGYTKVTDDIMVLYPDMALESLRTFEAEQFS